MAPSSTPAAPGAHFVSVRSTRRERLVSGIPNTKAARATVGTPAAREHELVHAATMPAEVQLKMSSLQKWNYLYELWTGIYMLDKVEKAVFSACAPARRGCRGPAAC